ncbi:MAG: RNA polymerase sigma-70 factor [Fulvivirga sp.]
MKFKFKSNSISDKKTILALKKGEIWAFKSIFNEFHLKLYHFSKKMGLTHEDAEGIVQDVFVTIWESKSKIDEKQPISAFLYTIAKRKVLKKVRRIVVEKSHLSSLIHPNKNINHETEDYVIFTNLLEHANDSIENMPPDRKQIFMLSKHNGLSNQEIADKLGISKRTVENQLYRATVSLKKEINSDFMNK